MVKKVIGIILIIISCILIIMFISRGLLFPHLSGPAVLGVVGIILFALKQKGKA